MATVNSTFEDVGVSASLDVKRNETINYTITGSATATVLLQVDRSGGDKWETVRTLDASENPASSYRHSGPDAKYRMFCSVHDSGTVTYSFSDADESGQQILDPYGNVLATAKESGLDFEAGKLAIAGTTVDSTAAELNVLDAAPVAFTVALAASVTVDGMDITITAVDAAGATVAGVFLFEMWISEAATGIGLTADTYSGDVTWGTGTEWEEIVSKKHYRVLTAASGIAVATAVASANPTDQYVAVANPFNAGKLIVSAASGTNWEGV